MLSLQASCVENLDVVQREMLRGMVGWVRIPEEPWNVTMRRMFTRVKNAFAHTKMKVWSVRLAEIQWEFIGRFKSLPLTSWPSRAAFWQPREVDDVSCDFMPHRTVGRPFTRWDDTVSRFTWKHFGRNWRNVPYGRFFNTLPLFASEVCGNEVRSNILFPETSYCVGCPLGTNFT